MKIIITGDGETGAHLAEKLSHEDQSVVLIGTDTARLEVCDSRYNILTQFGKATCPPALEEAGVSHCDMFIAVTPWEDSNLIAAQLAKSMGADRTIARIDSQEYLAPKIKGIFERAGVDSLVYPEYLASQQIIDSLPHSRSHYELHDGQVNILSLRVQDDAPIAGMQLKDFGREQRSFHICTIRRGRDTIIPRGDDVVMPHDILWFASIGMADEQSLAAMCGCRLHKISRLMIVGAGKMTRTLCSMISPEIRVTVIDTDADECRKLVDCNRNVTVVNANYRDKYVLEEEKLRDMDAFIALTSSSETNIVSCMVARDAGVPKTIAEIEDLQYMVEADSLNIDTVINKKLITSSSIYQNLLDHYLPTPHCLTFEDAEVAEIIAGEGAKITRAPMRDLKVPRGTTIAAIIRDDKGSLVNGNTHIRPGDHVVVFCLEGTLDKIKRWLE